MITLKNIIGIFNPDNNKIMVKGYIRNSNLKALIDVDLFEGCKIILGEVVQFNGNEIDSVIDNEWVHYVIKKR